MCEAGRRPASVQCMLLDRGKTDIASKVKKVWDLTRFTCALDSTLCYDLRVDAVETTHKTHVFLTMQLSLDIS